MNTMLTTNTKMKLHQACVLITLLYGCETCTTCLACSPCSCRDACDGSATSAKWKTAGYIRMCCMGSFSLEPDLLEGQPLCFKDDCKLDIKAGVINPATRESVAADRSNWRQVIKIDVRRSDRKRERQWEERRAHGWQRAASTTSQPDVALTCTNCSKVPCTRIGLHNHSRCCSSTD